MKYFVLFFISLMSFAQTKTPIYYKSITLDKIYTSEEYIGFKQKQKESLEKYSPETTANEIIVDVTKRNDSILKSFVTEFISPIENYENEDLNTISENLVGKKLPDFEFETLQNTKTKLSDFEEKPTLINFWFTNCKPCVEEMPVLNKIKKAFENKINFVSITYENNEDVVKFLEKKKFNFIHLVNANSFIKNIGIEFYPINILIDKNGRVQSIEEGIPAGQTENGDYVVSDGNDLIVKLAKLLK